MSDATHNSRTDLPPEILRFIKEHHVMVLSTCRENRPHAAALFYHFMDPEVAFLFTSLPGTIHSKDLVENPLAAGSIHGETRAIDAIQGLQFTGRVRIMREDEKEAKRYRRDFLRRFPEAAALPAPLWIFLVDRMKFTDNRVAFGHKDIWERTP